MFDKLLRARKYLCRVKFRVSSFINSILLITHLKLINWTSFSKIKFGDINDCGKVAL